MYQRGNNIRIDDGLDLGRVAGGDVGYSPASLLADAVLGRAQQREQGGQCTTVDNDLGLNIISRDDVAHRAKCGSLDRGRCMHQELHKSAGYAGFDHGLNLVVRSV